MVPDRSRMNLNLSLPDGVLRVLVVDPDRGTREEMLSWLEQAGYVSAAADSFESARSALKSHAPAILIVEVRLGAFNGLQLVISSQSSHARMRAVVTTAVNDPVLAAEAARVRAGYLVKPLTRDALLAAVAAVLGESGCA